MPDKLTRGDVPKMQRGNHPIKDCKSDHTILDEAEVPTSIANGPLGRPPRRCFACRQLVIRCREIAEDLYICELCDDRAPIQQTMMNRGKAPTVVSPGEALCFICEDPIINERLIRRQLRARTQGDISERAKEKIEHQLRSTGWRYIGQGRHAHIRCLNKKREQS
jgi:hypothetical protein